MTRLDQALDEYNQYLGLSAGNEADIQKYSEEWDLLCAIHCILSTPPVYGSAIRWAAGNLDEILAKTGPDEEIHYAAHVLRWGIDGLKWGVPTPGMKEKAVIE